MSTRAVSGWIAPALDPRHSVAIEACAGSGKTWLLVSRIVRALLAGAEPSEVLAITFTRHAAQEMAERLHQWLRLLALEDEDAARAFLAARALPEAEIGQALACGRGLYERVLAAQPGIGIATFHGWFLQLLRSAPADLALPSNYVLTERTAPLLAEAWTLFAEACRRDPRSPATQALDVLFADYGLKATREMLFAFLRHRADWWAYAGHDANAVTRGLADQAKRLRAPPGTDVVASLLAEPEFLERVESWIALAERNAARDQDHARALADALAAQLPEKIFGALCAAMLTREGEARARRPSRAQAARIGADGEARFLELSSALAARLLDAQQDCADQAAYRANEAGFTAGAALLEQYQQLKRERQLIDFADIEWLAHELLCDEQRAAAIYCKLDSRYRHVLLDEFQDTNPIQWRALLGWFGAAFDAGSSPRIFLVGDPKQAIFRFRRADARLFERARSWLREQQGALTHTHDESRRCAQAVLDVVNGVFASEPAFAPYVAHRSHDPTRPGRVEVLPLARRDAADPPAPRTALRDPLGTPLSVEEDTRREREARLLAARLAEILRDWTVADPDAPGGRRRARHADVMILARRRTHLAVYERALRHAGLPFITSRQGGLLATLEAADIMALLDFLIAPFDDLALAHALRSPIFALADEDLMRIAAAPGARWWEKLRAVAAPADGVLRARELLGRWLELAGRLPVHDTLDRIYFEGDVAARYRSSVPPAIRDAVAANLDAFIQRALEIDSGRYPSLPRFLAELRELAQAPAEEAPDEGEVAGGADAVRIMTVHGAKGLEAPIVWLLDAAAAVPEERGCEVLVQWQPEAPAPGSFSLLTRAAERSRQQLEQLADEARYSEREELNLLYVAMTRARELLLVSGCDMRGAADSWYGRVRRAVAALTGSDDLPERALAYGIDPGLAAPAASEPAAPLAHEPTSAFESTPVGRRRSDVGGAGTRYGVAFHVLMQHAAQGLRAGDESAVASQLGIPLARFRPMWAQAQRMLADPELERFFAPARYRRALNEWPLVTADGALRRVDRLVEFDQEVWVLDYKTGSRPDLAQQELEAEYRAQLLDYCKALAPVFPGKRVRGLLLFSDGTRLEVEPETLDQAHADIAGAGSVVD